MREYDTKLFEEFRSTKGLSPDNIKAREQRMDALKSVNNFIDTIKEQDRNLPEYLRLK